MKFITRTNAPHQRYHVAEQAVVAGLPEWRKMPLCHNGGLRLKGWLLVEVEPATIAPAMVCQVCRTVLEARGIEIGLGGSLEAVENEQ